MQCTSFVREERSLGCCWGGGICAQAQRSRDARKAFSRILLFCVLHCRCCCCSSIQFLTRRTYVNVSLALFQALVSRQSVSQFFFFFLRYNWVWLECQGVAQAEGRPVLFPPVEIFEQSDACAEKKTRLHSLFPSSRFSRPHWLDLSFFGRYIYVGTEMWVC